MKTISNDALYNYTRSLKFHQPTANRFGTARQNPVCGGGGGRGHRVNRVTQYLVLLGVFVPHKMFCLQGYQLVLI